MLNNAEEKQQFPTRWHLKDYHVVITYFGMGTHKSRLDPPMMDRETFWIFTLGLHLVKSMIVNMFKRNISLKT
jgi:hypothetical protein